METTQLLAEIEEAARQAGEIMRRAGDARATAAAKAGHANFVTEYDKKIQDFLFDRLSALAPEAHFIGEEDGADRFTASDREGLAFCVDPIDGTSNFMAGYRPSVTSIALLRDGGPFLGVVYEPFGDLLFTAVRGGGAFLNGKPLQAPDLPLDRCLAVFGTSPYNAELSERTFALCRKYLKRCIDLRRSGSAAWDLCCCAMGTAGLFFEARLSLWDYAAAALIAAEAGCAVTGFDGAPLPYDGPSSLICAGPGVAREPYLPEEI